MGRPQTTDDSRSIATSRNASSPMNATTSRFGVATLAPIAAPRAQPIALWTP